jgi:hypothetical protein
MNEVIIQDMILTTDNVLYRKEKYYSPLEGKTYRRKNLFGRTSLGL